MEDIISTFNTNREPVRYKSETLNAGGKLQTRPANEKIILEILCKKLGLSKDELFKYIKAL